VWPPTTRVPNEHSAGDVEGSAVPARAPRRCQRRLGTPQVRRTYRNAARRRLMILYASTTTYFGTPWGPAVVKEAIPHTLPAALGGGVSARREPLAGFVGTAALVPLRGDYEQARSNHPDRDFSHNRATLTVTWSTPR
jgi:hypothetical protein